MQWFGRRYDAPAWEEMEQCPTPFGMHCSHCQEKILDGDAGVLMGHWHAVGMTYEPVHIECFMRSMMGSVEHLEGRCSCARGRGDLMRVRPEQDDDEACTPQGTWREQGLAVMAWLQKSHDSSAL